MRISTSSREAATVRRWWCTVACPPMFSLTSSTRTQAAPTLTPSGGRRGPGPACRSCSENRALPARFHGSSRPRDPRCGAAILQLRCPRLSPELGTCIRRSRHSELCPGTVRFVSVLLRCGAVTLRAALDPGGRGKLSRRLRAVARAGAVIGSAAGFVGLAQQPAAASPNLSSSPGTPPWSSKLRRDRRSPLRPKPAGRSPSGSRTRTTTGGTRNWAPGMRSPIPLRTRTARAPARAGGMSRPPRLKRGGVLAGVKARSMRTGLRPSLDPDCGRRLEAVSGSQTKIQKLQDREPQI